MKKLMALTMAVVMAFGMTACNGSATSSSSSGDASTASGSVADTGEGVTGGSVAATGEGTTGGSKGTIGILMPSLTAEFFVNTANSCAKVVEDAGYTTNIQSFENDASQAVSVIENFITDGVDGIAYMTVDTAGDDALKEAMDAGIAVLTCGVETENYDVCQIADNYETGHLLGEMAAKYINDTFGGKTQVAYITSTKSQNMIDRVQGYKDAMQELCPDAEVVYEAECTGTGEGAAFAENLNTLYPDCKVVLSYSDTYVKEVAEVWNALGYPKDAAIFGHDAEEAVLADIAAGGYIKGTISMGDSGALMGENLLKYMNGEYDPHSLIVTDGIQVTADNVDEYFEG